MIDDDSDMELVRRAQQGDSAAFGELFARRRVMVLRYFIGRFPDRNALAQDLAQDVWLKAWRNLGGLSYGSPVAWLLTIARNVAIDYLRSGRSRLELLGVDMTDHDRPDAAPSTEDRAAVSEERRLLLGVIRTLPEAQQEAMILTYYGGMDGPQAGAVMGRSRQAVTALNLRGRRNLADRIPKDMR
jgi:RNA polymerase sigma-70 factor (ECF subfamily)